MCKAHSKVTHIKQQKYFHHLKGRGYNKNSVLYSGRFRWWKYFCCFICVTLLWALHIVIKQQFFLHLLVKKSLKFYTPTVFSAPAGGDPVGILWKCLMLVKLEWLGYRIVKKNGDNMLSRFHLIPERNGLTDRRTDRFAIWISRVTMLTRDKNESWPRLTWPTR